MYDFSPRMCAHKRELNLYSVKNISFKKSAIRVEVACFVNVFNSSRQIPGQYVILVKTASFHIPSKSSLTNLPFYIVWATNSLVKWTIRYRYLSDKYLQKIFLVDLRINGRVIIKSYQKNGGRWYGADPSGSVQGWWRWIFMMSVE